MGLALVYEPSSYSFSDKVMGRQSAGIGFLRALASTRPERIWCYSDSREKAAAFAQELAAAGAGETKVAWLPPLQPERLAEPGLLYRPDPVIAGEAWRRYTRVDSRAYSLCGITHTLATHAVMEAVTGLVHAPIEPWDALICTSSVARESVVRLIESAAEYAHRRFGATRFTLPQLPVIPLGVHSGDFDRSVLGPSELARNALGIEPGRFVVLFVGRLSFHAKAHPLPMYLALEQLGRDMPVTLVQAGLFGNPQIGQAFAEDARTLCPSVDYRIVDGKDVEAVRNAWAAADVFTSLSDNIQETFGLTPVEAMAAGLPVVVSDWDGYRDTVRDGVDGFRVPTLMPGPGHGNGFGPRYDDGVTNYDYYCGHVCQFTAVQVSGVAEAFRRLATNPDLRARMGASGRERVRTEFDWAVVIKRYDALWADLADRRRAAGAPKDAQAPTRPDRPDPFTLFASHPTATVKAQTRFCLAVSSRFGDVLAYKRLRTVDYATAVLPTDQTLQAVMAAFRAADGEAPVAWLSVEQIAQRIHGPSHPGPTHMRHLVEALAWLSKMGVLDFQP